jgi:hypothetical protein
MYLFARMLWGIVIYASAAAAGTPLIVQVSDYSDRPIAGVILSAKASSSTSAPTDIAGKTQITLAQTLQPGDEVALVLVHAPSQKMKMFAPWQGRAIVPKDLVIEVVLAEARQAAVLSNPVVVASLATAINAGANPSNPGHTLRPGDPDPETPKVRKPSVDAMATSLKKVSKTAGLDPKNVDTAIRNTENREPQNLLKVEEIMNLHSYQANLPPSQAAVILGQS